MIHFSVFLVIQVNLRENGTYICIIISWIWQSGFLIGHLMVKTVIEIQSKFCKTVSEGKGSKSGVS